MVLDAFKKLEVDTINNTVTFGAGVLWRDFGDKISNEGKSLMTCIGCAEINVVGSVVNGCHGSGVENHIFAYYITTLEMVFADGSVRTIHKDAADFYSYIINFDCVGELTYMNM